jgi:NADPH:quinone reductase-like Zn-dependent oxidoreductase
LTWTLVRDTRAPKVTRGDIKRFAAKFLSRGRSSGANRRASCRPFVKPASARKASFHGPLTRPDGAQLAEIAQVVDSGAIRATVSKTYRLDQLASAYEVLAGGHARGKLVIVP